MLDSCERHLRTSNAASHHQFAVYLADAYTQTVTPAAAASYAAASCRKPRRASGAAKPSTGRTCTAVRSPSRSATNSACAVRWLC
jgi:hypothetical protein